MPKTQAPSTIEVPGATTPFVADAVPDVFDERDLAYRPRLRPLPGRVDVRPTDRHVLTQDGNSCTGHAVAAMVNAVLARHRDPDREPIRVSPYMLYRMARRYDEFEGADDLGSSLRGALKGWYHHGLLSEKQWPSLEDEPDIDLDRDLAEEAMRYPLGAFYRVHAFRLDDMQSAVTELSGIVASAAIHEGWLEPTQVRRGEETMHVIQRSAAARPLGGHAFAIVGYNEVGFLVQNSWGRHWGRGGFATLPYDDWLETAYDAWVARPGVRSIVTERRRERLVRDTAGGLVHGRGPDIVRLQRHVVNLGNDGRLSTSGQFRSSPAQLDAVFRAMGRQHERWRDEGEGTVEAPPRRVVLYAHGGLNSETSGLGVAEKHLGWWLHNRVYPVTFAWQTGIAETLVNQLADAVRGKLPAGGLGFDLVEQFDRLVERVAAPRFRSSWEEMKENARLASAPADVAWPQEGPLDALADLPGATLTAARLAAYCAQTDDPVEVHLVGHSAGAIFLTALLPRLLRDHPEVPLRSVTFLAPALRADAFATEVVPLLEGSGVRFCSFGLDDARELDDTVGAGGATIYRKSLLYLVSRGLERRATGQAEVPLLGMERFAREHLDPLVARVDGELVWAPSAAPPRSRADARTHGGLDDDVATMTSVLLRLLGHAGEPTDVMTYRPHAADVPAQRSATSPLGEALERAGWSTD